MSVIITLAEAKAFLQIGHTRQDTVIQIMMDGAEDWVASDLGIHLWSASNSVTETFDGGIYELRAKHLPILGVPTKVEDLLLGTEVTLDVLHTKWRFTQRNRYPWAAGEQRWRLTFPAGYGRSTVPGAIKLYILNCLAISYRMRGGLSESSQGFSDGFDAAVSQEMKRGVSGYRMRLALG